MTSSSGGSGSGEGTGEIAQQVKALASEAWWLVPRTHITEMTSVLSLGPIDKRETTPENCLLTFTYVLWHTCTCGLIHTHKINAIKICFEKKQMVNFN